MKMTQGPTGGSFTLGMPNTIEVPRGRFARLVAWVFPRHWQKLVPGWCRGKMTVRGRVTDAIPHDADPATIQAALNAAGIDATVEGNGGTHSITFGGNP